MAHTTVLLVVGLHGYQTWAQAHAWPTLIIYIYIYIHISAGLQTLREKKKVYTMPVIIYKFLVRNYSLRNDRVLAVQWATRYVLENFKFEIPFKLLDHWIWEPIRHSETSVTNNKSMPRNNPEEGRTCSLLPVPPLVFLAPILNAYPSWHSPLQPKFLSHTFISHAHQKSPFLRSCVIHYSSTHYNYHWLATPVA